MSLRLGLNIDHVATVRNARGGLLPDPVRAARLAQASGVVDGITAHLREDRRHMRDEDIDALIKLDMPLNLEMAATKEMQEIALRHKPHAVCIVPEKREERTTEGGLDVAKDENYLAEFIAPLREAGSRVSIFIAADKEQIMAAHRIGASVIEIHTGAYCDAHAEGRFEDRDAELKRIEEMAHFAHDLGLEVHAGHGLTYDDVTPIAAIPVIRELNIGHFLIGESIFIGLEEACKKMRQIMDEARGIKIDKPKEEPKKSDEGLKKTVSKATEKPSAVAQNKTAKKSIAQPKFIGEAIVSKHAQLEWPVHLKDCRIEKEVSIGRYTFIRQNTTVVEGSTIGRFCAIARSCEISPHEHPIKWLSMHSFQYNDNFFKDVDRYNEHERQQRDDLLPGAEIGHDVWIAAKAIIRRGVKIGHGAVIGGGTFVNKDVEPYTIVAGSPMRVIRKRFPDETIEKLLKLEWWNLQPYQMRNVDFKDIDRAIEQIEEIKQNLSNEASK